MIGNFFMLGRRTSENGFKCPLSCPMWSCPILDLFWMYLVWLLQNEIKSFWKRTNQQLGLKWNKNKNYNNWNEAVSDWNLKMMAVIAGKEKKNRCFSPSGVVIDKSKHLWLLCKNRLSCREALMHECVYSNNTAIVFSLPLAVVWRPLCS